MARYKTKPVEIEAVEYTGVMTSELANFCNQFGLTGNGLVITTLEGRMLVSPGDFVVKGLRGEFYPCKPDVFHKKYERIDL